MINNEHIRRYAKMKRTISLFLIMVFGVYLVLDIVAYGNTTTATTPTAKNNSQPSTKRVAVLHFEDKSNFDSPTGCGCVPNFIGYIFSTKKHWDLEAGFTTMLERKLAETTVYQPVSRDELLDAMAEMNISQHSFKKLNKEQIAQLAKLLNADVIVVGEIQKFGMPRMKGTASRSLTESNRETQSVPLTTSYMGGISAVGYRNKATVKLKMKFYETSGSEIATVPIEVSLVHSLAGTQIAGVEASITESGSQLRFGQLSEQHGKYERPITKPTELNKIKFATPEYDRTLLGMATNEALKKTVVALRDNYGPNFITPWETPVETNEEKQKKVIEEAAKRPIKITYVDSESPDIIYINAGSARGLAIGQQFSVYTDGEPIRDVDTGEILDYKLKKIATVAVTEIRNDRLSMVKILEKIGDLKRGDLLKAMSSDETAQ